MDKKVCAGTHKRHWFTQYNNFDRTCGHKTRHCVRCGAPNPRYDTDDRVEAAWEAPNESIRSS